MKIKSDSIWLPIIWIPVWILIYFNLQRFVDVLVDQILKLDPSLHFTESLRFFLFEVPKVLMLLVLIIFFVGIIRTFFTTERTRKALEGRKTITGNVMASLLGVLTPFCSCSAIPLFLGFVEAGVPLGVTFSFLIASPMINEVAIVLLYGLFGWKVTAVYISTGLLIAIVSGWIIGILKLEKWIEPWVFETKVGTLNQTDEPLTWSNRISMGAQSVKDIVYKVWIYVTIGVAVGAGVHGYVPADFMASFMGKDVWYAVPLSILIGIPLYSNAAGIIPILSVLIEKGASLGTALAFMMSVIGLSLPEMIILRKVLKLPLILSFIGIVGTGILVVGYVFNFLF